MFNVRSRTAYLAGGLVVSTLLTLIVIPVVYSLLDRKTWAAATNTSVPAPAAN